MISWQYNHCNYLKKYIILTFENDFEVYDSVKCTRNGV